MGNRPPQFSGGASAALRPKRRLRCRKSNQTTNQEYLGGGGEMNYSSPGGTPWKRGSKSTTHKRGGGGQVCGENSTSRVWQKGKYAPEPSKTSPSLREPWDYRRLPNLPVHISVYRGMLRNQKGFPSFLVERLRHFVRERIPNIGTRYWRYIVSKLPNTILIRTRKHIGSYLTMGFRCIYKNALIRRSRWFQELYYSWNSVSFTCLGYLAILMARPWERATITALVP